MGYELVADSRASGGAPEHGDMAVAFDFDEGNVTPGVAGDEVGVCGVAALGWRRKLMVTASAARRQVVTA